MRDQDETALRAVWDNHHERLWRALLAWSSDREVASDATAEAFAQAARRGDEIRDPAAWIWRAAFRIGAGMLADRRATATVGSSGLLDGAAATGPLPEDATVLVDALGHLNDDDRLVIVLCLVGGWSAAEVGSLTGTASGTVRVRLHRAKARLRALLEVHDD